MLTEKKILIVEDEALIAFDLEDVVLSRGAKALVCLDLETALEHAEAGDIDVAILDYNISRRTVIPVADALQRKGIPFVFNTAMADFVNLAGRYEGAGVCRKPVNERELVDMLERLVSNNPGGSSPVARHG